MTGVISGHLTLFALPCENIHRVNDVVVVVVVGYMALMASSVPFVPLKVVVHHTRCT